MIRSDPATVGKIDKLLRTIERCYPPEQAEYAYEHVEEARVYLLGAMPGELQWSLELARNTLERMPKGESCRTARKMLNDFRKDYFRHN